MSVRLVTLLQESTLAASIPRLVGRSKNDPSLPGIGSGLFRGGSSVLLEVDRAGTTGILVVLGANKSDPNGNPNQQNSGVPLAQRFKGDGSTVAFQTQIPYVAQSGYNWIVQSSKFVLAGTASVTAGSATVTGSSTAFLADFQQGDVIQVGTEKQTVLYVQSDTVLITEAVWAATAATQVVSGVGTCLPVGSITMTSVGGLALCTLGVAPIAGAVIDVNYAAIETLLTLPAANSRALRAQMTTRDYMWTTLSGTPSATTVVLRALK